MIGQRVGKYQVIDKIGEGGMGTVYKAEDPSLSRLVAIKTLSRALSDDPEAKERFLREAQAASALNHPNIATVYELLEHDDAKFICMEYVEGKTIRDMVETGRVSVRKAVDIMIQACEALQAAHAKGILHRDIKGANIMVSLEGRVKVMDFGLALLGSRSQLTRTGTTMGTLAYASPEQITGRPLDARSEVYSLGVVFYELLAGRLPFPASSEAEVVFAIVNNEPEPLNKSREDLPVEVEDICLQMMEKDPTMRYPTVTAVLEDLRGVRTGMETSTIGFSGVRSRVRLGREGAAQRARAAREVLKKGWDLATWQVGAAALVLLALGLLGGRMLGTGGATGGSGALVWFTMDAPLDDATGTPMAISRDGRRILYVGKAEGGFSQIYRRDLDQPDAVPVAGTVAPELGNLTFSPDGESFAYFSNQELRVASVDGGGVRRVAAMTNSALGASWGPDDLIVFQPNPTAGLYVVSSQGGEARALTVPDSAAGEVGHTAPSVLPDGRWVLFSVNKGAASTRNIAVASLKTGEYHTLLPGTLPVYVDAGYLVYVGTEGDLRAVRFDARSGRITGNPISVLSSVQQDASGFGWYALSPTGTLVLASYSADSTPVLVEKETGRLRTLSLEAGQYQAPRLSPGGRAMVTASGADIWSYDLASDTFSPLTFDGGFYPIWTPDGRYVLYSHVEGPQVNIYRVPADRSREAEPVYRGPGMQRTQDIAPDGRHLLVRQNIGSRYELWTLDLDDPESLEPWLQTDFLERSPAFSPNGKWVAYSSDESGRDETYVRPFPGPGGRIQVSTDGGNEPAWSPDGKEIYFRHADKMMAVEVDTGERFLLRSKPRILFEGRYYAYPWSRQYDLTPDGKEFLMLQLGAQSSSLTVAMNWFQSVQDRLGKP